MNLLTYLIKHFEGYAKRVRFDMCVPYLCSAGVLTQGYGSTGREIKAGHPWTREQAESRLQEDLIVFSRGVFALSPVLLQADESRQAAIISMAYNCGLEAYRNSGLRKCVDRQDWDGARIQIRRWDKVRGKPVAGLVRRRRIEAGLI